MTCFDVHLADVLWRRDPSGRVRPIASFTPTQADGRDVSEAAFGTLAGFEAMNPSYADVLTVDASTDPATVVSDQGGGTIAVRVPQWYNGVETMRAGDDLFAPGATDALMSVVCDLLEQRDDRDVSQARGAIASRALRRRRQLRVWSLLPWADGETYARELRLLERHSLEQAHVKEYDLRWL